MSNRVDGRMSPYEIRLKGTAARLARRGDEKVVLTKGNKADILNAIESLPEDKKMNVDAVTERVVENLSIKYGDTKSGQYQLRRSGMETTGDVRAKVQLFFISYAVPVNGLRGKDSNLM